MLDLLQHYSLSEILIFTILLAIAIRSVTSFFDWVIERWKRIFNKEHSQLNEKQQLERRLKHGSQIMDDLSKNQQRIDIILNKLSEEINLLIDSDKDDIKSFITREHHYFCYQLGWIDDFSLDCIQKRFAHYKDEGGNSFICNFMQELRALPRQEAAIRKNKHQ